MVKMFRCDRSRCRSRRFDRRQNNRRRRSQSSPPGKGPFPRSKKNVSGAGLYDTALLEEIYPNFHKEAPIERYLVRKSLGFITDQELMSINYQDNHKSEAPYSGYTVMRGKLDKWLAEKAVEKGSLPLYRDYGYRCDQKRPQGNRRYRQQ